MTTQVDEFLNGFGVAGSILSHAIEAGGSLGKRKFDESKVKRDGGGQFSSVAGMSKRPDAVTSSPAKMDEAWRSNFETGHFPKNLNPWTDEVVQSLAARQKEIETRTGIKLDSAVVSKAALAARMEYAREVTKQINRQLSSSPAAISPSGTKRVQTVARPSTLTPGYTQFDFKLVDVTLKHADIVELAHALEAGSIGKSKLESDLPTAEEFISQHENEIISSKE